MYFNHILLYIWFLFEMYTEFSPYNYCNNSPMMFRDPSGLGMVEEIVDGCELVVRAIHEWLFGSDANPLEPGDDGLFGNRGGGGNGKNGVQTMASTRALAAANSNAAEFGGGNEAMFSHEIPSSNLYIPFGSGGAGFCGFVDNSSFNVSDAEKVINDIAPTIDAIHLGARVLNSVYPESGIELGTYIISDGTNYSTYGLFIGAHPTGSREEYLKMQYSSTDIPKGWKVVGTYHTHDNNSSFSDKDIKYNLKSGKRIHIIDNSDNRILMHINDWQSFGDLITKSNYSESIRSLQRIGIPLYQSQQEYFNTSASFFINTNRRRYLFKVIDRFEIKYKD
jgi:proteasome lid subunit RPN8/RPN11